MIKKTKYFYIALLYKNILKDVISITKNQVITSEAINKHISDKYNTNVFSIDLVYFTEFVKLNFLGYFSFKQRYRIEQLILKYKKEEGV